LAILLNHDIEIMSSRPIPWSFIHPCVQRLPAATLFFPWQLIPI